jgi:hypothetical protein
MTANPVPTASYAVAAYTYSYQRVLVAVTINRYACR